MTFSNADHLEDVLRAHSEPVDDRVGEIARAAIRHLHAFVEEVGLTRDEWFAGIEFLTAIGKMCDEKRQEFILLSDVLGVSMLVEMINQDGAAGTTDATVFGPFHVEGAPQREMGDSIVIDGSGDLTFRGVVRTIDGDVVEGAQLDVWQSSANGLYDVQDPGQTPMNMRGVFTTGPDGRYEFVTARPITYPIPDDGPTGDLLRAVGRHNWRPAHTHVVVGAPGHKTVITHLFDAESPNLDSDPVFGVRDSLVVDMSGGTVDYDFVIERADD